MTLYSISVLASGLATDRDGKHRNDCAPQSRLGGWGVGGLEKKKRACWHWGLLRAKHRFTAHQAEKIYTATEERDSNMLSPRQTHTRVYRHFSLADHRLSGGGFGYVHVSERVSVCVFVCVCDFFHTKSHSNQYFNSNCMFGFFCGGLWCLTIVCFGSKEANY